MRKKSGFTLIELLVVCLILLILSTLLLTAVKSVRDSSEESNCKSHLQIVGSAFESYRQDWGKYPIFGPPLGLGDLHNWGELWKDTDPGNYFFSDVDSDGDGTAQGNETLTPRIPILLEDYTESREVLHCTGVGQSSIWWDVGPYYYNTTFYKTDPSGHWVPLAENASLRDTQPLVACQTPVLVHTHSRASWRHRDRRIKGADGRNHHLYAGMVVKAVINPTTWEAQ